jgi:Tol biopolymer transport system component
VTDREHIVRKAWWSDDSTILYYWVDENMDEIWAYDLNTQKTVLSSDVSLPIEPEIPDDLKRLIPDDARGITLSPDQDKVIFFISTSLLPTPTPSLEGLGSYPQEIIDDIFLVDLKQENPQYIGRVDGAIDKFIWFPDGNHVIARLLIQLPASVRLWLVDINDLSLQPFFAERSETISISPDSRWVLFNYDGEVIVKDMNNNHKSVLPISFYKIWWLPDNERFIFLYHPPVESTLNIFDMRKRRVYRVTDQIISNQVIASLSPDQSLLAFNNWRTNELKIISLCIR